MAFFAACENEAHGQTVGQRTGEEVVGAWVFRAPERASTERRGAPRNSTSCACASNTPACAGRCEVTRESEGLSRAAEEALRRAAYAELQRKHRDAYGDNEEAREAAGKAALLRAKALHSPGWAARLRCEERGRLAAASVRRLRGVRQQVHRAQARESHGPWRERERERERSRLQSVSVSWCLPVSERTSAWVGAVFARVHKDQRMWVGAASVYGPAQK